MSTSLIKYIIILLIVVIGAGYLYYLSKSSKSSNPQLKTIKHPDGFVSVVDITQKHPNDKRKLNTFTLDNKLEVLLISDPNLNKSAAALDVAVGSLEDPEEHCGFFHFIEHMLFLGTKKYPKVGEYSEYLNTHQGYSNAYTSDEHTNYYFEVNHDAFEGALDRFSQFFIAPNFNPEFVKKEMNAVHSEHQKNIPNDRWREIRIEKMVYKTGHPKRKFGTGTLNTLSGISQEILVNIYKKYYSANAMKLVLMGKEDLGTMGKWVKEMFSQIPNHDREKLVYDSNIFDKSKLPSLVQIKPISDKRVLKISFATPSMDNFIQTKPYGIISSLFGHEGEGSLLTLLRKENLATNLMSSINSSTYYGTFFVEVELTDKGLKEYEQVIEYFFSYIKLIHNEGYKEYLYKEERTMAEINFAFREPSEGGDAASQFARLMHTHPALKIEENSSLITRYSKSDFDSLINLFKPELAVVTLIAPSANTKDKERYYDIDYSILMAPKNWIELWKNVKPHPDLHYPKENKYIPNNLELLTNDSHNKPYNLINDNSGIFWFQQDKEFKLPKARLALQLLNTNIYSSPRAFLLSDLYIFYLNESLKEWRYPIILAGIDFSIGITSNAVLIKIDGFSEKITTLIKDIYEKIKNPKIDKTTFATVKAKYKRDIENLDFAQPHEQAMYELLHITHTQHFHKDSYKVLVDDIKPEDLEAHIASLYNKIAIKGVGYGNLDPLSLKNSIMSSFSSLNASILEEDKRTDSLLYKLPEGKPLAYALKSKINNNCWISTVQFGPRTPKLDAILHVSMAHLEPKFYEEMRTKQQLGYIVFNWPDWQNKARGINFLIVSADHDAVDVQKRASKWISTTKSQLKEITPEKFLEYKAAVINKLKQKERTIVVRLRRIYDEGIELNGDFEYQQKVIAAVEKLKQEDMVKEFQTAFLKNKIKQFSVYMASKDNPVPTPSEELIKDVEQFRSVTPVYDKINY